MSPWRIAGIHMRVVETSLRCCHHRHIRAVERAWSRCPKRSAESKRSSLRGRRLDRDLGDQRIEDNAFAMRAAGPGHGETGAAAELRLAHRAHERGAPA